ncbi:hypothetical protein MYAM1_002384 [Malassezia yamatoensis]|uniref:Protein MEMO1 n=1 Tax=Malassezia yamatoensis TaxID=253288 RepID=A0AAJ5YZV7_9BASI|nr:hypothetical protein MYAM1_002384 [Malassezia yamatoensis]
MQATDFQGHQRRGGTAALILLLSTPLGDLDVDQDLNNHLRNTKQFRSMSEDVDEDEHSLELHFPYIRKVFFHTDVKVIPILVGQLAPKASKQYAETLANYLADPSTIAIISSDFCHWGHRFHYTYYQSEQSAEPQHLTLRTPPNQYANPPIHASIAALDAAGMASLSYSPFLESEKVHKSAKQPRKNAK